MSSVVECLPGMIGAAPSMLKLYELVRKVAGADIPIAIVGETGTGKELVARALHDLSAGRDGPFVDVNCGAIPEGLAESELFGWERGSFTGAVGPNVGLLETANRGTLFLDEACSLPLGIQAKLLRAIEQRDFRKVGGRERRTADFRLVVALAARPEDLVVSGALRADFAYRISGVIVQLPPLRSRLEDLEALAVHFLTAAAQVRGARKELGQGALALLHRYSWPGNVRELKSLMERLQLLTDGPTITTDHAVHHLPGLTAQLNERERMETVLDSFGWDVPRSARALGVSRAHLYRKIRTHGIQRVPDKVPCDLPETSYSILETEAVPGSIT